MSSSLKNNVLKALGVIFAVIASNIVMKAFNNEPHMTNSEKLIQVSSEINANLPMNVDSETVLISTSGFNGAFKYNYQLPNFEVESMDVKEFVADMKLPLINAVCTTDDLKAFRDMKIVVSYSYYDSNKNQIAVIEVDTKECVKT
ncbi:hypothetical protein SAMN04488540_1402 [Ferrimonas sediminum]|uniref:Uncharacterized protein n=1 Tax=Ferrimonas sediminum TaxID=718193 RepID=A0A1G9BZE8_9GAMM|nr:hypothetical protein [Ferrimonas sediminum]SDK44810.1 hypothetical protein SAMN04488540_1402 [Ferrimonas sediminum]